MAIDIGIGADSMRMHKVGRVQVSKHLNVPQGKYQPVDLSVCEGLYICKYN